MIDAVAAAGEAVDGDEEEEGEGGDYYSAAAAAVAGDDSRCGYYYYCIAAAAVGGGDGSGDSCYDSFWRGVCLYFEVLLENTDARKRQKKKNVNKTRESVTVVPVHRRRKKSRTKKMELSCKGFVYSHDLREFFGSFWKFLKTPEIPESIGSY